MFVIMSILTACSCFDATPGGLVDNTGYAADVATQLSSIATNTYDALNPKGKRKAPSAGTMHEDRHLQQSQRRQLIGGVRELRRNSSFLGWMVRRHLDYVTAHRFESTTGNDAFDDMMERTMSRESEAATTDVRGLFDLDDFCRMAEAMAVLDGDCGIVLIDEGTGLLQGIEGDRIRDPGFSSFGAWHDKEFDSENWYNGVHVNGRGKPIEYGVSRRIGGWTALEHERNIPADWFHLHAYYGRFDQYRGVSPISEAYNQLRDLYEAEDYAMIRSKISSLFAMAITRNADKALGTLEEADGGGYEVDFNGKPIFLDLDPGDDAKFLDSDNPGANLQDFWVFVSMVALKALDIPYGMFDESRSNFFGNKTAWLGYDRACDDKRKRCRKLLNAATLHKYRCLIRERKIKMPPGVNVADRPWKWVPRKMPWWRPLEEVTASLKAIGGGLTTPQRVCQESDTGDWYQNIDDIAAAKRYAEKMGVSLEFVVDQQTQQVVEDSRKQADKGDEE